MAGSVLRRLSANRRTLPHGSRESVRIEIGDSQSLAANAEALDQLAVARLVLALDIVEQAAALADHLQKAAAGVVVRLVGLEVLRQVGDALGQDRDLDVRR